MASIKKRELLIHGYIREIEQILMSYNNNRIIPFGVIQICCLFYSVPLRMILTTNHKLDPFRRIDPSLQQMCIVDINAKSMYKMVSSEASQGILVSACYIPDISSSLNINNKILSANKRYDGIVGIIKNHGDDDDNIVHSSEPMPRASIILFESEKITDETLEYHCFVSKQPIPIGLHIDYSALQIKFNEKYGAIFNGAAGIYQLELENLHLDTQQFNFLNIYTGFLAYNGYYSSTDYIYNENKLFAMSCHRNIFQRWFVSTNKTEIQEKFTAKCGIFDLETKQMEIGKGLQCKMLNHEWLWSAGICGNNKYDSNIIYIASNLGHTARYDINKNVWNMLHEDIYDNTMKFDKKPIVWMNDNPYILYYSCYPYFAQFDIRDDKTGWIKNKEMEFIYKKFENNNISLFI